MNATFDKAEAQASFAQAVKALCDCWDHLRDLENELGVSIETEDIEEFAGDDDGSAEAFDRLVEKLNSEGELQ